jgi:hypothetical protein
MLRQYVLLCIMHATRHTSIGSVLNAVFIERDMLEWAEGVCKGELGCTTFSSCKVKLTDE